MTDAVHIYPGRLTEFSYVLGEDIYTFGLRDLRRIFIETSLDEQ